MRRERERAQLPTVALAGYTNAGKSTLLNALTGADAGVRDRLFHTLDPTTRAFEIAGRTYLLTDTVGFIRKLPHQLVEAFAATLEEALEADLIVHVVDASVEEDELAEMLAAVDEVLDEVAAGDRPRLLALNKVDLLAAGAAPRARLPPPARRAGLGSHRGGSRRPPRRDRGALPREPPAHGAARSVRARAEACPSFTRSLASSSARTRPPACGSGRACRSGWPRGSSASP